MWYKVKSRMMWQNWEEKQVRPLPQAFEYNYDFANKSKNQMISDWWSFYNNTNPSYSNSWISNTQFDVYVLNIQWLSDKLAWAKKITMVLSFNYPFNSSYSEIGFWLYKNWTDWFMNHAWYEGNYNTAQFAEPDWNTLKYNTSSASIPSWDHDATVIFDFENQKDYFSLPRKSWDFNWNMTWKSTLIAYDKIWIPQWKDSYIKSIYVKIE